MNSLSNVTDPYLQSLISNAASGATTNSNTIDPSSLALPQESTPQLSPLAQVLSTLQQLQQSDPTEYQQVTAQIATNLQNAAQTATANGNSSQASQLNQLASDFKSASQNNTLPNIQDLAQAAHGAHGHHHHHHVESSPSDSSGTAGNSTSNGSSTDPSQFISAFLANATSPTASQSLDPLSIINNTLAGANLS